ncbi:hypothetical protein YEEN111655_06675 [Yersinia entomophaga]
MHLTPDLSDAAKVILDHLCNREIGVSAIFTYRSTILAQLLSSLLPGFTDVKLELLGFITRIVFDRFGVREHQWTQR